MKSLKTVKFIVLKIFPPYRMYIAKSMAYIRLNKDINILYYSLFVLIHLTEIYSKLRIISLNEKTLITNELR